LVREKWHNAIHRYEKKYFQDAVLHAIQGVELALAIRLDSVLDTQEKNARHESGWLLPHLINSASAKGLLPNELRRDAHRLNQYRTIQVHPLNSLTLLRLASRDTKTLIDEVAKDTKINPEPIVRITVEKSAPKFLEMGESLLGLAKGIAELPKLEWTLRDGSLASQEELLREYIQEVIKRMVTPQGVTRILSSAKWGKLTLAGYILTTYGYEQFVADRVLQISRNILKSLSVS